MLHLPPLHGKVALLDFPPPSVWGARTARTLATKWCAITVYGAHSSHVGLGLGGWDLISSLCGAPRPRRGDSHPPVLSIHWLCFTAAGIGQDCPIYNGHHAGGMQRTEGPTQQAIVRDIWFSTLFPRISLKYKRAAAEQVGHYFLVFALSVSYKSAQDP